MKSGDREVQEEEEGGNNIHQYTSFVMQCVLCLIFIVYINKLKVYYLNSSSEHELTLSIDSLYILLKDDGSSRLIAFLF